MLNHSHRQLLLSILTCHKIHAYHFLQIGSFRCWNSRQLPRNRNVNISAVSESRHLGLIPTDIIVTDKAKWYLVRYHFSRASVTMVNLLWLYCDVIQIRLWRHQQTANRASDTRSRHVKIVLLSCMGLSCRVRTRIMHVLSWRTVTSVSLVCIYVNTEITLSWVHNPCVTQVHTYLSLYCTTFLHFDCNFARAAVSFRVVWLFLLIPVPTKFLIYLLRYQFSQ